MGQTRIECKDVAVTLDNKAFRFDGLASGYLTLKVPIPPDPPDPGAPTLTDWSIAPSAGTTSTPFVWRVRYGGPPDPEVYLVLVRPGAPADTDPRQWVRMTSQGDGAYAVTMMMTPGTWSWQIEAKAAGQTALSPGQSGPIVDPDQYIPDDLPGVMGPLRREGTQLVRPDGKVVRLFGRHTWDNVFDVINDQRWRAFDFPAYLAAMKATGENVTRLWRWEQSNWMSLLVPPDKVATVVYHDGPFTGTEWVQPWLRPMAGPRAADGLWQLDFSQPDPLFYARVRERVLACQAAGIYPIVMLHEGCLIRDPNGEYWHKHAMAPGNNVQGYGSTRDAIYQPGPLRAVWEDYIARMVANLADCPMVIWEVANEARVESLAWQEWVMSYVRELESQQPIRHPIGMTAMDGGTDEQLAASSADWIAPGGANWQTPNFANPTGKPVFIDSDHLWGMGTPANGCTTAWVQQLAANGYHGLLMDPHVGNIWPQEPTLDPVRAELGRQARALNA